MFQIRVHGTSGLRTHPLSGAVCTLGRDASNDVVVEGTAVSGRHCQFELTQTGCVIRDLGSSNGTYVNGQRIAAPTPVSERDRIYIGSVLLELTPAARARASTPIPTMAPSGPILRTPGANRDWRDLHGRFGRYADEWDARGQPDALTLKSNELTAARKWLARAREGTQPEVTRAQREFIAASVKVAKAGLIKKILLGIGGVVLLASAVAAAVVLWPQSSPDAEPSADTDVAEDPDVAAGDEEEGGFEEIEDDRSDEATDIDNPDEIVVELDADIEHISIPFETLADISRRYGVSVDEIAAANFLNPDEPALPEGTKVTISSPKSRPLPQQKVTYEIEPGEGVWTKLATRFDVPATRLQAYNPEIEPKPGTEITVWIDPKPYAPREPRKPVPEFTVDKRAVSVGAPNRGKLVNGIQMPESDLYTRRKPYIMWGSSFMVANLQKAVATFRADLDFDGIVILADMSKQNGGHFKPHKSHQAGRDIDIWLPTLKGVYKRKYLGATDKTRPRKPHFEEVDWYATWGFVRSLIKTGAVKEIFLDWRYQGFVYRAAVNMGATQEELDEWIQWPRSKASPRGIFRHSKDHLSHIHVRFKCAPWEKECSGRVARTP